MIKPDILRKDIYSVWRQITHFGDKPQFEMKTRPSDNSPCTQTKNLHIREDLDDPENKNAGVQASELLRLNPSQKRVENVSPM